MDNIILKSRNSALYILMTALVIGLSGCTSWIDRDGKAPIEESDSDRIENMIAVACAPGGGRKVTLGRNEKRDDGRWMIDRAILVPSDFTLELDGACVELRPGTRDNIVRNAGASATGIVMPDRNIRIVGKNGAVLSGGCGNYFSPNRSGDSNGWRSMGILFSGVENYEMSGFMMKETQCWGISQENGCSKGYVHDIVFDDTNINRNQDGIDVRKGCHDILIENISGVTGDDTVALTGLRRPAGQPRLHNGFKYPVQIGGWWPTDDDDIHDITVRNIRARSAGGDGLVRLLVQDGVKMYNITVSNIVDTTTGEQLRAKAAIRIGDSRFWSMRKNEMGEMHHITISDVDAKGNVGVSIKGPISDSKITGIKVPEGVPRYSISAPLERVYMEPGSSNRMCTR
jgi:hypothetical protein